MPLPSHHDPHGGFRNPWPLSEPRGGVLDLLRWIIERNTTKRRAADPDPASFARATPKFVSPRAAPHELLATWVGHSTFLLQIGGVNVLTDPMWSDRASPISFAGPKRWMAPGVPFDSLPPIDLVVLSHNHYDHLDVPTIGRLGRRFPEARWVAPLGVGALIERAGGGGRAGVTELDWWQETEVAGVQLACTPARHFSARGLFDRNRTLWCGWSLSAGGHRAFFAGDTAFHDQFGEISHRHGPFHIAFVPIGAYEPRWFMSAVHMNAEEAVAAFMAMQNESRAAPDGSTSSDPVMVAMHWGTFKLTDEPMDEPPRRARDAWSGAGLADDSLWVMAFGETRRIGDTHARGPR